MSFGRQRQASACADGMQSAVRIHMSTTATDDDSSVLDDRADRSGIDASGASEGPPAVERI
jgi:hypothetical protein